MHDRLKDILRREDIEGFIEGGAPPDVYDPEAEEIAAALGMAGQDAPDAGTVFNVLFEVWTDAFEYGEDEAEQAEPYFRDLARRLAKEII